MSGLFVFYSRRFVKRARGAGSDSRQPRPFLLRSTIAASEGSSMW